MNTNRCVSQLLFIIRQMLTLDPDSYEARKKEGAYNWTYPLLMTHVDKNFLSALRTTCS